MNLESLLEETIANAEAGTLDVVSFFDALSAGHPELFVFLFDADTRLLLEPEHDYMLFLSMVILNVILQSKADLESIDLDSLEEISDHNWGLLEHTSIENITETLSRHPVYPLYAFLEEACTPQTGHEILSDAAGELVYIKCKTLIDSAHISSS